MKYANRIDFRVFSSEDEDFDKIKKTMLELVGYSKSELTREKILIKETTAKGFEKKDIRILEVIFEKDRHINKFLERIKKNLSKSDITQLHEQENRLDDNLNFFFRLEKNALFNKKCVLTDSGTCFHVKINIAAFPKNKENALKIIKDIFNNKI